MHAPWQKSPSDEFLRSQGIDPLYYRTMVPLMWVLVPGLPIVLGLLAWGLVGADS